jgi:7,8-dihydropterin-6-yl-methyl-4-(beta-D-ribofuranosyl)aminobenzene 5'-phosphate synthase
MGAVRDDHLGGEDCMRVTSLVDNNTTDGRDDLGCEFGLSLHIETAETNILFDTGASGLFADNAEALGIDLASVDLAVLSHHHFDHGGGLDRFLDINPQATVHLRGARIEERYFKALAILKRPIGLDRGLFERHPDRFHHLTEDTEVAPGVWLLTEIATTHPRPRGNRMLYVERDGRLELDPFDHELILVIHEPAGMVVFTGCSHSGILNMIETAATKFVGTPTKAAFGGFHLVGLPQFNTMAASRSEVEQLARNVLDRVAGPVYTGHCTGMKAFGVLAGVMGDTLSAFPTGTVVNL